jgi:tryptophan-rich sensory protein
MRAIASPAQLRMAYARWALVTVPAILFLGILSGRASGSGDGNPWFDSLAKPSFMPPSWAFPVAWTLLYILMGLALAMVVSARGAERRGIAIGVFLAQLALNLCWSPVFFAFHRPGVALALILVMIALAAAAAWLFARIRVAAGLMLLPYLAWLCFAAALNFEIVRLNPDAAALVPSGSSADIPLKS